MRAVNTPKTPPDAAIATKARKLAADRAARKVAPIIEQIQATIGTHASLHVIAAALKYRGIQKPRGGTAWTATDVKRVKIRVAKNKPDGSMVSSDD